MRDRITLGSRPAISALETPRRSAAFGFVTDQRRLRGKLRSTGLDGTGRGHIDGLFGSARNGSRAGFRPRTVAASSRRSYADGEGLLQARPRRPRR